MARPGPAEEGEPLITALIALSAPSFDYAPSFYLLCWSHRSFLGSLIVNAHNSSSQFSC